MTRLQDLMARARLVIALTARRYGLPAGKASMNPTHRISANLSARRRNSVQTGFPLQINPVAKVSSVEEAVHLSGRECDVVLIYGDYLKEAAYAARKLSLAWVNVTNA